MLLALLQSFIDAQSYARRTGNDWTDFYNRGSNIANGISQFWDRFKNGRTNEINKDIADQNLQFQRENLDYQKGLQQQIFDREDTAYQRTVNDMRMAGLNPLSMQGTNGAGEAIATEPMNNSQQYTDQSNMAAMSNILDVINQLKTTNSNATLNQANANLINEQAKTQAIQNIYQEDLLQSQLRGVKLSNLGQQFKNAQDNIKWLNDLNNFHFNSTFHLSDNMPDWLKAVNIATNQGKDTFQKDWQGVPNFDQLGETNNYGYYDNNNAGFNTLQSMIQKNTDLSSALSENKIANALLSLLGIKL